MLAIRVINKVSMGVLHRRCDFIYAKVLSLLEGRAELFVRVKFDYASGMNEPGVT
jgi:hypothetical protein